eukprot:5453355-Amphidinium_carterae.2
MQHSLYGNFERLETLHILAPWPGERSSQCAGRRKGWPMKTHFIWGAIKTFSGSNLFPFPTREDGRANRGRYEQIIHQERLTTGRPSKTSPRGVVKRTNGPDRHTDLCGQGLSQGLWRDAL